MFELKITGLYEAGLWVKNGWATHCVSMVDPSVEIPFTCKNHLVLHLHDVESQLRNEWVLGSEEHIDAILEFTKCLKDTDRLLVHCHQGISRSTSAAIGIMIQHGMDATGAYRYVESIRDILLPNGLITKMIDDRFGLNGELYHLVISERKAKMQRRMDRAVDSNNHDNVVEMKSILEKLKNL